MQQNGRYVLAKTEQFLPKSVQTKISRRKEWPVRKIKSIVFYLQTISLQEECLLSKQNFWQSRFSEERSAEKLAALRFKERGQLWF